MAGAHLREQKNTLTFGVIRGLNAAPLAATVTFGRFVQLPTVYNALPKNILINAKKLPF